MDESPTNIRMVVLAAIIQNLSTGLLFGTFGTLLFAIESGFGADRGQSTLALSLSLVSLSLTAAWLGTRVGRQSLRPLMALGSVLCAAGFGTLAVADSVWALWGAFLFLLGPGCGLAGVLATNTLAAAWSTTQARGRALGWVNAPIFVTIAPLACAWLLARYDLSIVFLVLGAVHILMLPLYAMVREPVVALTSHTPADEPARLFSPLLLLLVVVIGVISGGGMLKLSHMLPLVTAQGHSFDQANLLLSISGGSGILGSMLLGWLADRIGAARTLAINGALQGLSWMILLVPVPYPLLVLDAVMVGMCGGGLQATLGTLFSRIYGPKAFARVYGLLSLLTLPFLFGIPWIAGVLFVSSGGYFLPIALQIGGFFLAALGALAIWPRERSLTT